MVCLKTKYRCPDGKKVFGNDSIGRKVILLLVSNSEEQFEGINTLRALSSVISRSCSFGVNVENLSMPKLSSNFLNVANYVGSFFARMGCHFDYERELPDVFQRLLE